MQYRAVCLLRLLQWHAIGSCICAAALVSSAAVSSRLCSRAVGGGVAGVGGVGWVGWVSYRLCCCGSVLCDAAPGCQMSAVCIMLEDAAACSV
jgi:hypothetical protein